MRRFDALAISVVLVLGVSGSAYCHSSTAPASGRSTVQTPMVANCALEGAPYRIDIPDHWNGALVMLMHGYEPKGMPRGEPWPQNEAAPVFLQRGYAVAASAFSSQGWAVAEAVPDNERLRQYFVATYAKPQHTYAVGISLGGYEALASLEQNGKRY